MRFVKLGRFTINLDAGRRRTGLERSFEVTGPDAEKLRAALDALGVEDYRPEGAVPSRMVRGATEKDRGV
jgi:hypothetical protein